MSFVMKSEIGPAHSIQTERRSLCDTERYRDEPRTGGLVVYR
jgi:hypothetical protein